MHFFVFLISQSKLKNFFLFFIGNKKTEQNGQKFSENNLSTFQDNLFSYKSIKFFKKFFFSQNVQKGIIRNFAVQFSKFNFIGYLQLTLNV